MRTTKAELRNEIIFGFVIVALVTAGLAYLLLAVGVFSYENAVHFFGGSFTYQVGYKVAEFRYRK